MTIELVCECGTVLRAPDSAAGKEGRCKACGRMLRVPTPKRRQQDEARDLDPLYRTRPRLEDYEAIGQPTRGFWSDAGRSFLLDLKPLNLIPVVFAAFLYGVLWLLGFGRFMGMAGTLLMLLGRFFVFGWLCSFWMNIIRETASGEDEIPTFKWEGGAWEDIAVPFLEFVGSLLAVMAPAITAAILAYAMGSELLAPVATGLAVAGLFAWPAALLVVSIGGIGAAFQLDAIALTIVRSFVPYLAIVGLIALAVGAEAWAAAKLLQGSGRLSAGLGMVALESLVQAWAMIVSMRCIGLYYRHFKHRFPWSAE